MNQYLIAITNLVDTTLPHKDIDVPPLLSQWFTFHEWSLWENVEYRLSVPEIEGNDVQDMGNTLYIYFECGDVFENTDDIFEDAEESYLYMDFCEFVKEFYNVPRSLQFDFILYDIQADIEWEWEVYEEGRDDFQCFPTKGYSSYTNGGAEGPLKRFQDKKYNKEIRDKQ